MSKLTRKFVNEIVETLGYIERDNKEPLFSPTCIIISSFFLTFLVGVFCETIGNTTIILIMFYVAVLVLTGGKRKGFKTIFKSILLLVFLSLVITVPLIFRGELATAKVFVLRVVLANITATASIVYLGVWNYIRGLRTLGVPEIFCKVLYLTVWSITLIVNEYLKMMFSRSIRVLTSSRFELWRVNSSIVGDALIRSSFKAKKLFMSMSLRGGLRVPKTKLFDKIDVLIYGVIVCVVLTFVF